MPSFTVVPTTAKMPIAAMMKGPGPAKYGLPSCLGWFIERKKHTVFVT